MRQDIKDTIARLRYERDQFRGLSIQRRKDAAEFRKNRRWLEALQAIDRCHEYRDIAIGRQNEIERLKKAYTMPKLTAEKPEIKLAKRRGYASFITGKPRGECPYALDAGPEREAWLAGWDESSTTPHAVLIARST
jgi:ribosome modulation factor